MVYCTQWKRSAPGGCLLINSTAFQSEYWIEGGLRMTADFVIGLVTCIATVAGTVIAALSYLKGKDKE